MRGGVFVCAALLAIGATAGAQTSPTTPPLSPAQAAARLDQHMKRWEQEMRKVYTLSAAIARVEKDTAFKTVTKYSGYAQYMKSGTGPTAFNLALLEMRQEGKAEIAEKFICTGVKLYQFLPAQKEIRTYDLPKPGAGGVGDDTFLGFLFGMRADQAKTRYHLSLAKEDAYYIYVDVIPKSKDDKADFTRARIVLNKDSFLPRQLWFEHTGSKEVTWDIPRLQTGVAIDRRVFDAPVIPRDWKLVPVPRTPPAGGTPGAPGGAPPRVIRPSR